MSESEVDVRFIAYGSIRVIHMGAATARGQMVTEVVARFEVSDRHAEELTVDLGDRTAMRLFSALVRQTAGAAAADLSVERQS